MGRFWVIIGDKPRSGKYLLALTCQSESRNMGDVPGRDDDHRDLTTIGLPQSYCTSRPNFGAEEGCLVTSTQ